MYTDMEVYKSVAQFSVTLFFEEVIFEQITEWWPGISQYENLGIMGSSFIHLIRTDLNEFFLMAE